MTRNSTKLDVNNVNFNLKEKKEKKEKRENDEEELDLEKTINKLNNLKITCKDNKNNNSLVNKKNLKKRCNFESCRKKFGLFPNHCKCGFSFCSKHRLSHNHNCTYDFKSEHIKKLEEKNPVIIADKLEKI